MYQHAKFNKISHLIVGIHLVISELILSHVFDGWIQIKVQLT